MLRKSCHRLFLGGEGGGGLQIVLQEMPDALYRQDKHTANQITSYWSSYVAAYGNIILLHETEILSTH